MIASIKPLDLTGTWHSYYRHPSSARGKDEFWGKHTLFASQQGSEITLVTEPSSASHVEMWLSIDLDKAIATGKWQERTDPKGHYGGTLYEGTVEFTLSDDATRLSGTWHGEGRAGEMNSGAWELSRQPVEKES